MPKKARRSKKAAKKALRKASQNKKQDGAEDGAGPAGYQQIARDDGVASLSNPSTINDSNAGDKDLTMLDCSPVRPEDNNLSLFDSISTIECYGVDIFRAASTRDRRDRPLDPSTFTAQDSGQQTERSLGDVYTDHPDAKLSNLDEDTLKFAGQVVRQVVFDATHHFLQKCIPESDRQRIWAQILGQGGNEIDTTSISIPHGMLDLKGGLRSFSYLMENCMNILSQDFLVTDQKTLKLAFNRAIALCDALNNEKRKQALEETSPTLDWLMLGLECKTMAVYRNANKELDDIDAQCSVSGDLTQRRHMELGLLRAMKDSYEGLKEPFRVDFLESLQRLMAADIVSDA